MNKLWRAASLTLLLSACAKPEAAPTEISAQPEAECTADTVCTREYRPTSCRFDEKDFSSSNPCETRRLVREYACKAGKTYDESKVDCRDKQRVQ